MLVLDDPLAMRRFSDAARAAGERIALVPTMGYLHEGHFSLVQTARRHGTKVVVSIFVNPTQFGPNEDFSRYPRDMSRDLASLEALGVDAVYTPTPDHMYPPGFDTYVVPEALARQLCGKSRPGHFRGVCTVVLLLFRITRCHAALFGEKDFQQLQIIRRMTQDLWLDVEIIGLPIVREPDGLAMSSRNVYLSPRERKDALSLSRALATVEARFAAGERQGAALVMTARAVLESVEGARIDYVEVVDQATLQPVTTIERDAVCALAVLVGKTRLIDNRQLRV